MTEFIAWLDEQDPESAIAVAGAKMGRLSELSRLGLRVPQGFTVTVDAYTHHCAETGLAELLRERRLKLTDPADQERIQVVADTVRANFETTPLSPALGTAIADAYAELAFRCGEINIPVAVRSSATGEDGAQASFAGIFETYLGMSGVDQVVAAIKRCWASLFSARALTYRLEHGGTHWNMPMAVGVLELVPARLSGVAFSIHPVSGKRDRMVIEGTWGWGEAVVGGAVTPDHIEVGKSDRRVLSYDVADKRVVSAFDYAKGEVVETEMPPRFRNARVLDDEQIGAVADAVGVIEEHYGHPVDVEWVIDRARRPGEPIFIVQTRPVTVADHTAAKEPLATWDPGAYAAKYAFGKEP